MQTELRRVLGTTINIADYPSKYHDYISRFSGPIKIEELWRLMDQTWDFYLEKYQGKKNADFFASFYGDPIWCLNAIFTTLHADSIKNRKALCLEIERLKIDSAVDMGGGYGELAKLLKKNFKEKEIILCEPYSENHVIIFIFCFNFLKFYRN